MKQRILFAVIMALINASIISFTLTAYNAGFSDNFLIKWMANFIIAFCIVVPSIIFVGPKIQNIIYREDTKKD